MSNKLSQSESLIKILNFNKKYDILNSMKKGGPDLFQIEVDNLIHSLQNNRQKIYERRREIEGVGMVRAEGKYIILLQEALQAYQLGLFYSTISLSAMAAERICYDYIDFSEIIINGKALNDAEKHDLYNIPLTTLIEFIFNLGLIDNKSRSVLLQINTIRNQHVHPKMNEDEKKDSIKVLNLLCKVTDSLLSIFRNHYIKDGKLIKK